MPDHDQVTPLSEAALAQHEVQQSLTTSDLKYVETVVRAEAARLVAIAMAMKPQLDSTSAAQIGHLYKPVPASNMLPTERFMVLNTVDDPFPMGARLAMRQASPAEGSLQTVQIRAQAASVLAASASSTESSVLGQAEAGSR
ncbi:hypothetical protein B0A48_15796 [Cryoendolithus antarcticus]|uniref:Uncharacterized protein n=1 Tax=Cryoendolithus antarcticus TaxID=1507870 RepID=A0A1V8SHB9_9PEZI|nr:hypothetical protein B0A48_15796 [Cryoendolithus antarcticus]